MAERVTVRFGRKTSSGPPDERREGGAAAGGAEVGPAGGEEAPPAGFGCKSLTRVAVLWGPTGRKPAGRHRKRR